MTIEDGFEKTQLPYGLHYLKGRLPSEIVPDVKRFREIWAMRPTEPSIIRIGSKKVRVPRFDKAYGRDYPFSWSVAVADPVPDILAPFLTWAKENIEPSANGLFVNWHDASLGQYHGHHRDYERGVIKGTPITTIWLGLPRVFRLRPYPVEKPAIDINVHHGHVIVIPWETNQNWYHEIPKLARNRGLQISVKIRSFE
jgi:alkylated DNA repair dioxygenase AlkB